MITFDDTIATNIAENRHFYSQKWHRPFFFHRRKLPFLGLRQDSRHTEARDGTGPQKNPAGQSQMHPNALKCIIHEIQYNSIPIG
jgi:hypothetical protein